MIMGRTLFLARGGHRTMREKECPSPTPGREGERTTQPIRLASILSAPISRAKPQWRRAGILCGADIVLNWKSRGRPARIISHRRKNFHPSPQESIRGRTMEPRHEKELDLENWL
ncbi:hypothetical protein AVEN_109666-1 [Araneus ventricosus]|uniref:Uncharacterized protein n=1 Tax=Araneus ventricosus TaxID=182803 RepID=A0A4Y2G055_ARAVE|nr:hypothetical protein AVEN_109666-1 [Araneus ventricosus]